MAFQIMRTTLTRVKISCLTMLLAYPASGIAAGGAFNGGGGGNSTADSKLTFAYAQTVEKDALAMLPYVFQQIEFWSDPSLFNSMPDGEMKSLAPSIYGKLFAKKLASRTVYEVLPDVKVVLREHGVCVSPNGQDVDGSASAFDGQHVCLSFERLAQKLTTESSWPKMTALLAHEVSHLLGTTEPEAQFIQKMIEATVTFHQTFSNFDDSRKRLLAQLADVQTSLQDQQNSVANKDEMTLQCMGIQKIVDGVQLLQSWQVNSTQAGISLLSIADQYAVIGLLYQATSLRFFCTNSANYRIRYDQAFNGLPSVNAAKFVTSMIGSSGSFIDPLMIDSSIQVQHIGFSDSQALSAQLVALLSVEARLKKDADRISFKF